MATEEYRALVGMNYPDPNSEEGEEIRVEAGDKITVVPDDDWVRHHTRVKNIEPWVPRQTDNVKDTSNDAPGVDVTGVKSRHANSGEDIVLKEVSE